MAAQSFSSARLARLCAVVVALAAAGPAGATDFVQARIDGLTNTGDAMAYVLPAAALGMTAWEKDGEGAKQFVTSAAITMGITGVLKYTVDSTRPDGEPHSFPSGHAAITFSSAEFLRKRYGWEYGLPAYLLATFVGYSRVRAHVHYTRDVVAGAVIGVTTTYLVTTPYHGWHVEPKVSEHYLGLRISRRY